jgi:hypothetical protein
MNTLTSAISVPNIQKMRVDSVQLDSNTLTANVNVSVLGSGNIVYGVYPLLVKDGTSQGIRASISPLGYMDRVELFASSTSTGFTDLVAVYTGGIAARNKAAETQLIASGLMPAGTVA